MEWFVLYSAQAEAAMASAFSFSPAAPGCQKY